MRERPGDLGVADGEGLDVEAAAGEQPGDAGQQAGLVLDEEAQHVARHGLTPPPDSGAWSRAYCTSLLPTPCGTIGHTIASRAHDEVDHDGAVVGLERELDRGIHVLFLRRRGSRGSRRPRPASRSRGSCTVP